jgi:uncharacterized iron-regulated protein
MKRLVVVLAGFLAAALPGGCGGVKEQVRGWDLSPYPMKMEPQPDDIYHLPTGLKVERDGFMDMISRTDVVFVGETHTNIHAHRVQLEIIREFHRRFLEGVAVGMEMYRVPHQESLDRWSRGELSEREFLKESKWFQNWSSDFGYYRDIMNFARENRIDVIALNPSKELQAEVSGSVMKGDELSPELSNQLPEMGEIDPFQEQTLRAVFSGHEGGDEMMQPFLRVQILWEETMASRIVEYLGSTRGRGKKLVVIAGSGHVQHGFGVPKKVLRRKPLPYTIVLPDAISIPEEKREELIMDVNLPEIPLLAGDFAWMVPYEDLEDNRVRMGILMEGLDGGVSIKRVLDKSPAAASGLAEGDRLLFLDGFAVEEMSDVILVVNSKKPGDEVAVTVERGGEERVFTVRFPEKTADEKD